MCWAGAGSVQAAGQDAAVPVDPCHTMQSIGGRRAPTMRARCAEPYPASKLPTLGPVWPNTALSAATCAARVCRNCTSATAAGGVHCTSAGAAGGCTPAQGPRRQVADLGQDVAPAHAPAGHHGDHRLGEAPDLGLHVMVGDGSHVHVQPSLHHDRQWRAGTGAAAAAPRTCSSSTFSRGSWSAPT